MKGKLYIINRNISREIWLFPVIQATREARTVGWLEKEGVSTPWQNNFCGRIMANLLGKANRGGQAPVKIQLKAARTEGREFEPQPETLQHCQTQFSIL